MFTDFNQVGPFDALLDCSLTGIYDLAHKCTQLCAVIGFAPNTTATDGKYHFLLENKKFTYESCFPMLTEIHPFPITPH